LISNATIVLKKASAEAAVWGSTVWKAIVLCGLRGANFWLAIRKGLFPAGGSVSPFQWEANAIRF
jgi:hypothetical protein